MSGMPSAMETLQRASGLWDEFARIAPIRIAQAELTGGGIHANRLDQLRVALRAAYSADKLRSYFAAAFAPPLTPADMDSVLRWFRSRLGRKIVAAEARTPPASLQWEKVAKQLLTKTPQERKRRLGEDLMRTVGLRL